MKLQRKKTEKIKISVFFNTIKDGPLFQRTAFNDVILQLLEFCNQQKASMFTILP